MAGWMAYEGYCYWFQRTLVTEPDSAIYCAGLGAVNIHIRDRYVSFELDFIEKAMVICQKIWEYLHYPIVNRNHF